MSPDRGRRPQLPLHADCELLQLRPVGARDHARRPQRDHGAGRRRRPRRLHPGRRLSDVAADLLGSRARALPGRGARAPPDERYGRCGRPWRSRRHRRGQEGRPQRDRLRPARLWSSLCDLRPACRRQAPVAEGGWLRSDDRLGRRPIAMARRPALCREGSSKASARGSSLRPNRLATAVMGLSPWRGRPSLQQLSPQPKHPATPRWLCRRGRAAAASVAPAHGASLPAGLGSHERRHHLFGEPLELLQRDLLRYADG